jgi:hypothetical protein
MIFNNSKDKGSMEKITICHLFLHLLITNYSYRVDFFSLS